MANGFQNPYMSYSTDYFIDPTVEGQFSFEGEDRIQSAGGFGGSSEWLQSGKVNPQIRTESRKLSELGFDPMKSYNYDFDAPIMSTLNQVFSQGGDFDVTDFYDTAEMRDAFTSQVDSPHIMVPTFDVFFGPNMSKDYSYAEDDEGQRIMEEQYGELAGDPTITIGTVGSNVPLATTNLFDAGSIADTLSRMSEKDITAAEVSPLNTRMLDKTEAKYYEPLVEETRGEALFDLAKILAPDVSGGFAGSSTGASRRAQAKRGYDKRIRRILEAKLKQRAQATTDITDRIMGWQELI